ncbi:MAG: hypothetical protein ACLQKA_03045 [Bryobacteraceae bacterium]
MKTIEDLQAQLERILAQPCSSEFPHYRIRVSLLDKKQRKKRKNASADYWTPLTGGKILLSFEPVVETPPEKLVTATSAAPPLSGVSQVQQPPSDIADLIRALNDVEARPGYGFVALKWFRDQVLPAVRPEWNAPEPRSAILRDAIERGLVLTSKVPNPKSPAFPVTAIRLNRSLPEVAEILGAPTPPPAVFSPIAIRGEELSQTVLRERR